MNIQENLALREREHGPLFTLLFFILITLFSSCDKDVFKSDEEHLTTGSWRLVSAEIVPPHTLVDGTVISDWQTLALTCDLDNTITYTEEKTYFRSQGADVCPSTEPISEPGYWRIVEEDGEKRIEYDYDEAPGINYSIKLRSVSKDQLILVDQVSSRVETYTYTNVQ